MIEGLTFIEALGVIDSCNHGRVFIEEYLLVTICPIYAA